MRYLLAVLLSLGFAVAQAQTVSPTCLPYPYGTGSPLFSGVSKNGAWAWWFCPMLDPATGLTSLTVRERFEYVGTVPEFSKIGGRLATIVNALDPLKSLQTAGSRFTILPLSDPSLAAVVADMRADQAKR